MIEDIKYVAKNGILIFYRVDGYEKQISFKRTSAIWAGLEEETFEGGKAYLWDDTYIAFSVLIASGQGGTFFVWDAVKEDFVHYSECAYFSDALWVNNDIVMLQEVSNYITPYHLEVYAVPFGTMDIWETGQRVYCEKPEEYHTSSQMGASLRLSGNRLEIVDDDTIHLFSSDVNQMKNQLPNDRYAELYQEYGQGMDPRKNALKSMIT